MWSLIVRLVTAEYLLNKYSPSFSLNLGLQLTCGLEGGALQDIRVAYVRHLCQHMAQILDLLAEGYCLPAAFVLLSNEVVYQTLFYLPFETLICVLKEISVFLYFPPSGPVAW